LAVWFQNVSSQSLVPYKEKAQGFKEGPVPVAKQAGPFGYYYFSLEVSSSWAVSKSPGSAPSASHSRLSVLG
jgi:hypothetical protein